METLKFKTSINCGGCIATVTPFLQAVEGIQEWNVDTKNPARILSVTGEKPSAAKIIDAVKEAGFEITQLA